MPRGVVWTAVVLVVVAGALVAGWWFEREDSRSASAAPARPEAFCTTAGEMRAVGELTVAVGEDASALVKVRDGLTQLAAAGPPAPIRDDLGQLTEALDAAIAEVQGASADDPQALAKVIAVLDERLGPLDDASARVNAYTERWCGMPLNQAPTG